MKLSALLIFCLTILLSSNAQNPVFTPFSGGLTQSLQQASIAAADYDLDGYIDLFISGETAQGIQYSFIFKNSGAGFSNSGISLGGSSNTLPDWGDFDNDGDLDIAFSGTTSGNNILIYRNDGSTFTSVANNIQKISYGCIKWADLDNDGDLDLIVQGNFHADNIFRNDSGSFVNVTTSIPGIDVGYVSVADYDKDGDEDVALCGTTPSAGKITDIYRNDGNFVFTPLNLVNAPSSQSPCLSWGDFDSDGDLDLAIASDTTEVFRNDGNDVFTCMNFNLPYSQQTNIPLIDLNLDGHLDLFRMGMGGPQVYWNLNDTFSFISHAFLLSTSYPAYDEFFDFDNDSDLDFVHSYGSGMLVAENDTANHLAKNQAPSFPAGLVLQSNGLDGIFSWNPSTDDHTPSQALSYDVRIGTTPGGSEIFSGNNGPNGQLRNFLGNVQMDTFKIIKNLPSGTYYWSVSTIDGTLKFSTPSPEITTAFTSTAILNASSQNKLSVLNLPNGRFLIRGTTSKTDLTVYSMSGIKILAQDALENESMINLENYSPGIYLLKCTDTNQNTLTMRIHVLQ